MAFVSGRNLNTNPIAERTAKDTMTLANPPAAMLTMIHVPAAVTTMITARGRDAYWSTLDSHRLTRDLDSPRARGASATEPGYRC